MNVLIVFAHPNLRSFNAAMRAVAVDALTFARNMFRTAGIEVLPPFVACGVSALTANEREMLLESFRKQLLSL